MRVARSKARVQAHRIEQLVDPLFDLVAFADIVNEQWLTDDLTDVHARVEAGIGILEDHLHPLAGAAQVFALQADQIDIFEINVAGSGSVKLQDGAPGGGFSTARFAHQANRLAFADGEGDAIYGVHHAHLALEYARQDGEMFDQIIDAHEYVVIRHGAVSLP